jgi:hypothetical protein
MLSSLLGEQSDAFLTISRYFQQLSPAFKAIYSCDVQDTSHTPAFAGFSSDLQA